MEIKRTIANFQRNQSTVVQDKVKRFIALTREMDSLAKSQEVKKEVTSYPDENKDVCVEKMLEMALIKRKKLMNRK